MLSHSKRGFYCCCSICKLPRSLLASNVSPHSSQTSWLSYPSRLWWGWSSSGYHLSEGSCHHHRCHHHLCRDGNSLLSLSTCSVTKQSIKLKDRQHFNSLFSFLWLLKYLPFWCCDSWRAKKRHKGKYKINSTHTTIITTQSGVLTLRF